MKSKPLFFSISRILFLMVFMCAFKYQAHSQYNLSTSSYLGDAGSTDKVYGSRIQSDGTIVLAANIGNATPGGKTPVLLNGASSLSSGAIIRLSADGKTVLSVTRIAAGVLDLAIDNSNNIYVAAAYGGLLKLNSTATSLTWVRLASTYIYRVDAGPSGKVAALKPSNISTAGENAGEGTIYMYQADGTATGSFAGHNNTQDVAIDEASQTINVIGWRQETQVYDGSAGDGFNPVQIAYLRGYSYTGSIKWTDYDWSKDVNSPNFLNKVTNNMADTRGYRCSIGGDGKLYCGFEAAGGNHIFRYSPSNISTTVSIVGGDKYHTFSNTASEHKTFFARYEPSTGAYLKGQQLVNRNPSGTGNTIRMINGEIRADALGRVYIGGISAGGLPMTYDPLPSGSYSGGAWFMIMSSDFTTRLFVTRVNTSGSLVINSSGETSAIDGRILSGSNANYVWGGLTNLSGVTYIKNAIQSSAGGGTVDGFFAVGTEGTTPPPPTETTLTATEDAYVRNGTYANTNYGSVTELQSKNNGSANDGYSREAYLKFDLSPISGTISDVKLRLYGNLNDINGTNIVSSIYSVATTSWTESTIKWSNKPSSSTTALSSATVANTTPAWYEFDVTAYIQSEKAAGRNVVALVIKNPNLSTPYTTFASSEASANKPSLVVTSSSSFAANSISSNKNGTKTELSKNLQETTSLYPIPAKDKLFFKFEATNAQKISVKLYNESGQLVSNSSYSTKIGSNEVAIPLAGLPNGIYYLSAVIDSKVISKKVVVVN